MRRRENIGLLGYALLALVHKKPASGYELRKTFTDTPMAGFSDSPGAIYPALLRLEKARLLVGQVESAGLRQRKVYRLSPKGVATVKSWLNGPVDRDTIANRMPELILRFAFYDSILGEAATTRYLGLLKNNVLLYVGYLTAYIRKRGPKMPTSARLALECGLYSFEAHYKWAAHAHAIYLRANPEEGPLRYADKK